MIALLFLFIAGFAKGLSDRMFFHWSTMPPFFINRPNFWNPKISWKNKYKDLKVNKGPRFLFSTTALVGFTDGWHLLELVTNLSFLFAILLYEPFMGGGLWFMVFDFAAMKVFYHFGFLVIYR